MPPHSPGVRTKEALLRRPGIDQFPAVAAALTVWLTSFGASMDLTTRTTLVVGVATIAGLVMAAATFICALTYQSANILMTAVRDRFATELRRNWRSIIGGAFLGAVLPVLALPIAGHPQLGVIACAYSVTLVSLKFLRASFWLRYTLFMQQASDLRPIVGLREAPNNRATSSNL